MSTAKTPVVDHLAVEVADLDARVALLTSTLGLRLLRLGTLVRDPARRVAMIGDGAGFKVELIESPDSPGDRLAHVAMRSRDLSSLADEHRRLIGAGAVETSPPQRFEPASSFTSTVEIDGTTVQLVAYDADSPDGG